MTKKFVVRFEVTEAEAEKLLAQLKKTRGVEITGIHTDRNKFHFWVGCDQERLISCNAHRYLDGMPLMDELPERPPRPQLVKPLLS